MSTAEIKNPPGAEEGSAGPVVLVPSLLSIAKSSRAFLTLLLAEIGLHPGQDQLLQCLRPDETVSVSVLAEQLAVRPSTVSKMLDRLIERDLVQRASSDRDARRTLVMLTPEGAKAREAVWRVWAKLEADLRGSFPDEAFEAAMPVLERVDALLAAKLRRLR